MNSERCMVQFLATLLSLVLSLSCALTADAAGLTRRGEVAAGDLYNPHPTASDILLPMPCGMQLALAPVGVRADGLLWDLETRFGCVDCGRDDMGYYDRQYVGHISAPFTGQDVPASWRSKLPSSATNQQYYFIGRYEVSTAQWEAVVNGVCLPSSVEAARPKTGISWYEAVLFTERHMEWLLAEHPDSLPRFADDAKNIGVLRLPTEPEWEYAARGGHAVSANTLLVEAFFPMEDGATQTDYAVFRDGGGGASGAPERIGSRRPNPLGLYDVAGNAAEMTMDTFKFSLGGRLHGSSGGFVRKGGSYLTGPEEILPGRREECALFLQDGPARAADLGFRVALSGINTPAGRRSAALREEWRRLGSRADLPQAAQDGAAQDPMALVDALIANARTDAERQSFEALRATLKDARIAQERHNADTALTHAQAAVHAIYTLRNLEQRRILTDTQIALMQSDLERMSPELRSQYEGPFQERLRTWNEVLASITTATREQFINYRALLEKSLNFDSGLLDNALAAVAGDIKGNDIYATEMRRCHARYSENLTALRQGRAGGITVESLVR